MLDNQIVMQIHQKVFWGDFVTLSIYFLPSKDNLNVCTFIDVKATLTGKTISLTNQWLFRYLLKKTKNMLL